MTGCKYCTEYEELPEEWTEDGPIGKVFDTSISCYKSEITGCFSWFIEIDGKAVGLQYCPFCGRKLLGSMT